MNSSVYQKTFEFIQNLKYKKSEVIYNLLIWKPSNKLSDKYH